MKKLLLLLTPLLFTSCLKTHTYYTMARVNEDIEVAQFLGYEELREPDRISPYIEEQLKEKGFKVHYRFSDGTTSIKWDGK